MIHYKPVAVSRRDGHGHAFSVEVGGGELRHHVQVLAPDGAIVGEVTTDGYVYWDPPIPRFWAARADVGSPGLGYRTAALRPRSTARHRPLSPGGESLQEWLDAFTLASGTPAPRPNW